MSNETYPQHESPLNNGAEMPIFLLCSEFLMDSHE